MWSPVAQTRFDMLNNLIVHSLALVFDQPLPIIVTTDTSEYGLGAVWTAP